MANELAVVNSVGLDEPININNIENFTALEVEQVANDYLAGFNWISDIDANWRVFTGADIIREEIAGYRCICTAINPNQNPDSPDPVITWTSQNLFQTPQDCQNLCSNTAAGNSLIGSNAVAVYHTVRDVHK